MVTGFSKLAGAVDSHLDLRFRVFEISKGELFSFGEMQVLLFNCKCHLLMRFRCFLSVEADLQHHAKSTAAAGAGGLRWCRWPNGAGGGCNLFALGGIT